MSPGEGPPIFPALPSMELPDCPSHCAYRALNPSLSLVRVNEVIPTAARLQMILFKLACYFFRDGG